MEDQQIVVEEKEAKIKTLHFPKNGKMIYVLAQDSKGEIKPLPVLKMEEEVH